MLRRIGRRIKAAYLGVFGDARKETAALMGHAPPLRETGRHPRFGFTRHGQPVHAHVTDHLMPVAGASPYARFNAWLAVKITAGVGSMSCAYLFAVIALISLPAALASGSVIIIVSWVAQTLLQLVLLSIILVGQSVQSVASDARAAKTFEDAELVIDMLRLDTQGGLADLYAKLSAEIKDGSEGLRP